MDNPADVAWEGMRLDVRVMEVDPIHRRIVLSVTNIPEDQPPRPEGGSTVIMSDEDDHMSPASSKPAEAAAPESAAPESEPAEEVEQNEESPEG